MRSGHEADVTGIGVKEQWPAVGAVVRVRDEARCYPMCPKPASPCDASEAAALVRAIQESLLTVEGGDGRRLQVVHRRAGRAAVAVAVDVAGVP